MPPGYYTVEHWVQSWQANRRHGDPMTALRHE
jgi:hypothetical protein